MGDGGVNLRSPMPDCFKKLEVYEIAKVLGINGRTIIKGSTYRR